MSRRPWAALVVVALLLVSACAPKSVTLPEPGTTPTFPDYIFPVPPAGLGTPETLQRHDAGWQWLQAGDLKAAQRNFDDALELTEAFYPAEAGLGYVDLARQQHGEAVGHFDRAIVQNPRYVPALVGRGEALLADGDREMALKSFEAAVGADLGLTALKSRIEVLRVRGLQDDVAAARKAAEAGRLDDARKLYEQAVQLSPDSPFLYRELAVVSRRQNDLAAALTRARRAIELEPSDPRAHVLVGEILEAQGDLAGATGAFEAALAIEPDPALAARLDVLRETVVIAALPPEFQQIDAAPTVSRAQMAALFGVRLAALIKRVPLANPVVITDTRGAWATPWILAVTRAGIMEVYANHTFQPSSAVRRVDLAEMTSRALTLIAAEQPQRADAWRGASVTFPDVAPGHLSYQAASMAIQAGVMQALPDGSFQLARPVSGAEAAAAVRKLEELAQSNRR